MSEPRRQFRAKSQQFYLGLPADQLLLEGHPVTGPALERVGTVLERVRHLAG